MRLPRLGEQVVTQATEGAYGTRAIDAIINQMKVKEDNIKKAGRDLADWLGTALTTQFKTNVPGDLFDILIVELIPLMTKALAAEGERGATATP
jgi:ribosomal protein S17E